MVKGTSQADLLLVKEKISPLFLGELLGILGKPVQFYMDVWCKKQEGNGILIEEGFAERSCECGIEKILELYRDSLSKVSAKPERYRIQRMEWVEIDDQPRYRIIFSAEFTSYHFHFKADTNKISAKKFNLLVNIIEKYKVENNINLLFHE